MPDLQHFPRLGASACVWKAGKVLLVQRAKAPVGLWSLPGGQVERGETALAAAERELLEETGITARLSAFVGLYEIIRQDPPFHYAIACYGGFWTAGKATASSDAKLSSGTQHRTFQVLGVQCLEGCWSTRRGCGCVG